MPWNEETTMSIKQKFISIALQEVDNFSELCREFQISRPCGYKWLTRFKKTGLEGLKDRSRRPVSSPLKTPMIIEQMILEVREKHPAWGARKIFAYLTRQGKAGLPDPATITRILHRYGKISKEDSLDRKAFKRFEHALPNQLWQMDFKGHFALGTGRCNPLTILDDCSRFSLAVKACKNQQEPTVKDVLTEVFRTYGMPERMTMDNGAPWGHGYGAPGFSRLEVWLIRLGILTSHSRPYHPQTQGKDERFHRSLKAELLKNKIFTSFEDAQQKFDAWRHMYNTERPHEALAMNTPATKYQVSPRKYAEKLPEIEYGLGGRVRMVKNRGDIDYKGQRYFISESMAGLPVQILDSQRDGILEVYLCSKKVREIDLINKISARKID
jgi:transposase InsO family protein